MTDPEIESSHFMVCKSELINILDNKEGMNKKFIIGCNTCNSKFELSDK